MLLLLPRTYVVGDNEVTITTTSVPTIVNLTNHTYFNLKGLTLNARHYAPVDDNCLTTGSYKCGISCMLCNTNLYRKD